MYPGLTSLQVIGTNLLILRVIIRYSICLSLILCVTLRYLDSRERFLKHINTTLMDKATIGKDISIWLYSEEYRIKKYRQIASTFSK